MSLAAQNAFRAGASLTIFSSDSSWPRMARTAQRVLGGAHPLASGIEGALQSARAALAARETPSASK